MTRAAAAFTGSLSESERSHSPSDELGPAGLP